MLEKTLLDATAAAREIASANPLLLEKTSRSLNGNHAQAQAALTEVIRFLQLVATHDGPLTPSHKVDLAWHEFILFTRAYHRFCESYFGEYIHHTPGGHNADNQRQYREALAYYREAFGPPSLQFWDNPDLGPAASECGACDTH